MVNRTDYDVIVVGARCAGAPTAMLLARRGHRALLVDRAVFPRDTLSTHFVHASGVARLARWGLLPALLATNCPPVPLLTSDWGGDLRLSGTPLPYEGIDFGLCPRRYVLDHLLNEAAVAAGADFEQGFTVTGLVSDGDRVTGVLGRDRSGTERRITARCVVGADGQRSLVARTVGAEDYWAVPPLTTTFYTYLADLPLDGLLIHWRPGVCTASIPTHDGLTMVSSCWPGDGWGDFRTDVAGNFAAMVEANTAPGFAERFRDARRVAPIVGSQRSANFFRTAHGPGWALVGDAGCHKDPITALGISDAFRDTELLVDALDEALSGHRPEAAALAGYERRRNEAAKPLYDYTVDQARLQPLPPERVALLRALQQDEASRARFFGVLAGSVPLADFYRDPLGRGAPAGDQAAPPAAPAGSPAESPTPRAGATTG
ncbi:MAG TPA: NAD(P)/FAD-dependent oxidoreductase [Mycobacteriales bacterium]|jgi:2-polyprenyl-6-methoxyphenol hydroxylase-like FAD-dependent oxidoreductase|nr:NAD(P)/FAD-dependent oxidoreductase [Mycobacteriales bacterium]